MDGLLYELLMVFSRLMEGLGLRYHIDPRSLYDLVNLGAAITFFIVSKKFTAQYKLRGRVYYRQIARGFIALGLTFALPMIIWRVIPYHSSELFHSVAMFQAFLYAVLVCSATGWLYSGIRQMMANTEVNPGRSDGHKPRYPARRL